MEEAKLRSLRQAVESYICDDPGNQLVAHDGMRIYDAPLIGVADADDPLFERLRDETVVGPHHRTPREWLPSARRVISIFLPFTEAVRSTNRSLGLPSEEWTSARIDGEEFNRAVRLYCASLLESWGECAVVPPLSEGFAINHRKANWSERHVGYIAGLGSFGLGRSLITAAGSAGRLGSVVTTLLLPVTPRTAVGIHDACPFYRNGECGDCIVRCPAGAISEAGKDIAKCAAYIDREIRPRYAPRYGCAKCQVGVRCETYSP